MTTLNLYNLLQECKVESDVEEKYKRVISRYFPDAKISSPYYTDGLLENGLKMLMEFKYNFDLTKRLQLVDLLIQLIYYLKDFENHGDELPTIIFGGDFDECFCLHSNDLIPYLNEDIDWSIAPSIAPSKNPVLAKKLYNDQNIKPYIFSINNNRFDFQFVVDQIKQLHEGTVQKLRITELNINRFFSYFMDRIIKQKKKYDSETFVAIFLGCLIDSNNNYPHPKKKNLLVTTVGEVSINGSIFDAFFEHFETNYSIDEKKRLTAICDRLIDDEARRFRGEFYTPTEWVLEAHKMIEEQFGPNWKEEYVVWDPAWGTGNLTRDFKFKELYCSTINYGDLQVGKHYNPEAVKFQYDFLNDDVTPEGILPVDKIKMPRGLLKALEEDKKMILFANPPYGKATPISGTDGTGMAKNLINKEMLKKNFGISSSQLYLQFLYRIIKFNRNINIAFYTPTMFLSSLSGNKFRDLFFKNFKLLSAFKFRADHFSNTSSNWAIAFTIWQRGREYRNSFNFKIKDFDDNHKIYNIGNKNIYNTDSDRSLSNWYNNSVINRRNIETPNLNGPLSIKNNENNKFTISSIGSINNHANNQMQQRVICISSSALSLNGYKPIETTNFMKVVALFITRTSIPVTWINQKDEYLAPNEQHPEYLQWNTDAIIYSLFSAQSSLRKITYKDKIWDIKNEWFWMPNSQMLQLANENGFDELYHDATGDHDRFVFNKIKESSFSKDAIEVLNKAIELVIKTFPYREQLHEEHPEWHLHAWDAGWYQIKKVLNTYMKDDLKEFNELHKEFENRMREGVYKFGFLK